MAETEEQDVDFVERQAVGETYVGLADEAGVHIGDEVAGVALAVDEDYFCLRVIQQYAQEFAGRVAGSSDDSNFNHVCG